MSKRVTPQYDTRCRAATACIFALLLCTLLSGSAFAVRPLISIERTHNSVPGTFESLEVTYQPNGSDLQFAGFDLLISYDADGLTLIDVTQGDLLTNCGWQYFTYRIGAIDNCPGNCPPGSVRIVAVGDIPMVDGPPLCNLGQNSGTLAVMNFFITADTAWECLDIPVEFYWSDCATNALSSITGATLFTSDSVFSFLPPPTAYPVPADLWTIEGWPESCVPVPAGPNNPVRAINFRHGSVSTVCSDSVDYRGDLNLNGIPYEIADAVIFSNYFFHGLAAFNPDPAFQQAQIAASEVNANGIPLEFRDFIYLLRVIAGDALPFPKQLPADTLIAIFTQNSSTKSVKVQYTEPLAGAFLIFTGEIVPTFLPAAPGGFVAAAVYENGSTRVLIAGAEPGQNQGSTWFTYTGTGTLQSVETTDYADSPITVQIIHESGATMCGDVNQDHRINIGDAVALIGIIFNIWPGPFDPLTADVDCSGSVTITDAVYLLQYIFAGGPAPCAACN